MNSETMGIEIYNILPPPTNNRAIPKWFGMALPLGC